MKVSASHVCLLLAVFTCRAVAGEKKLGDYIEPRTRLIFPETIGDWKRASHLIEYEDRRLGVGIGYTRGDSSATFLVYDAGLSDIPDVEHSDVARKQLNEAIEQIKRFKKYYVNPNVEKQGVIELASADTQAHHAILSFGRPGFRNRTHLYLLVHKRHFVKLRTTTRSRECELALDQLVNWLGDTLATTSKAKAITLVDQLGATDRGR